MLAENDIELRHYVAAPVPFESVHVSVHGSWSTLCEARGGNGWRWGRREVFLVRK